MARSEFKLTLMRLAVDSINAGLPLIICSNMSALEVPMIFSFKAKIDIKYPTRVMKQLRVKIRYSFLETTYPFIFLLER
jgi:hypothetical protein